jgi:hypothetical protein
VILSIRPNKIWLTCLCLSLPGFGVLAETAPVSRAGNSSTNNSALDCQQQQQQMNCEKYKMDPELKHSVYDCSSGEALPNFVSMGKACGSGILESWAEILKLLNGPKLLNSALWAIHSATKEKTDLMLREKVWFDSCLNKTECIENLMKAAQKRDLTIPEKESAAKLKSQWFPAPYATLRGYWDRACGPGIGCNTTDPWFKKQVETVFPTQERALSESGIAKVKEFLHSKHKQWQCFNAAGRSEMFCYALASVIDPVGAAALVAKYPKLAKMVNASKGEAGISRGSSLSELSTSELAKLQAKNRSLGDAERLQEIEKTLGLPPHSLTPDQQRKLLEIHSRDCAKVRCTAQEIRDIKELRAVREMFPQAGAQEVRDLYRRNLLGREIEIKVENTYARNAIKDTSVLDVEKAESLLRAQPGTAAARDAKKFLERQADDAIEAGNFSEARALAVKSGQIDNVAIGLESRTAAKIEIEALEKEKMRTLRESDSITNKTKEQADFYKSRLQFLEKAAQTIKNELPILSP